MCGYIVVHIFLWYSIFKVYEIESGFGFGFGEGQGEGEHYGVNR